jgi:hypothetical protein
MSLGAAQVPVIIGDRAPALVNVTQAGVVPTAVGRLTSGIHLIAVDPDVLAGSLVIARRQAALPSACMTAPAGATEVSVFIGDLAAAAVSVVEGRIAPTAVSVLASRPKPVAVEVDVLTGSLIGAIRPILRQTRGPLAKENEHHC